MVQLLTPRRDKELRFPVRDSPDYKMLKITVFNDDKKTDLIGETMLSVDKILVPGGGTDDGWRTLKCKDKYAGDILVELTFWDLRPKSEAADRGPKRKKSAILGFEDNTKATITKKLGGAREMGTREMGTRDRTVRGRRDRAPEPSPPKEERPRTSKSRHRHSYHPGSQSSHQHTNSEPQAAQHPSYSSRRSGRAGEPLHPRERPTSMVLPQETVMDPYDHGDPYAPGPGVLSREEYDEDGMPYQQQPPPPSRGRPYHSHSSPVVHQSQDIYAGQFPNSRHYQSTPQLDQYEQPLRALRHSHSMMDPYDDLGYSQDLQASISGIGADFIYGGVPELSNGPSPMSSAVSSRDGPPPPPPPPHRSGIPMSQSPVEMPTELDEPNWDNHREFAHLRQKSIHDEIPLPPAYQERPASRGPPSPVQIERRRSFVDLPASLIPGIDPIMADDMVIMDKRIGYNGDIIAPVRPLSYHESASSQRPRSSRKYHAPQVEEVRDVQLFQPQLVPEDKLMERPAMRKGRGNDRHAPIVKPLPVHGGVDPAFPMMGGSRHIRHQSSSLVMPERKPAPVVVPTERSLGGLPFSPDSYDQINPIPAAVVAAGAPKKHYDSNGRLIDPSDVLGPDTFAPEPEARARSPRPPPQVPEAYRRQRIDRRSASPQPPRGRSPQPPRGPSPQPYGRGPSPQPYSGRGPSPQPHGRGQRFALPAPEYNPGPVVKQVTFGTPERVATNSRLQKRSIRASQSMANLNNSASSRHSMAGGMVLYDPNSERERDRQYERELAERDARALVPANPNMQQQDYNRSMEMTMYAGGRNRGDSAPPLPPPKIPMSREEYMLSQEMSLINIGVGDGGGRARRTRY